MYNDQLIYKVVIWAFCGISLWKEKVALRVLLVTMLVTTIATVWHYYMAIYKHVGILWNLVLGLW